MTTSETELLARMGHKFSRAAMDEAFKRVQHPSNWKLGNQAWIDDSELAVTEEAVTFFAGSPLQILKRQEGRSLVYFSGYYACIGA